MPLNYSYPDYEIVRNEKRCIACRVCERQCANGVHSYDADARSMISDESKMRQLPQVRLSVPDQSA